MALISAVTLETLPNLSSVAIIAAVTFILCFAGVRIGRVFGTKLAGKATIFGGIVLVVLGISIFIRGILGL